MAYAAVVTWQKSELPSGRWRYNIHVVETEAAAGSAWSTKDDGATNVNQVNQLVSDGQTKPNDLIMPPSSTLRLLKVSNEGGTGTTYTPRLGKPETPGSFSSSTKDLLAEVAAAAAFIMEAADVLLSFAPNHSGHRYLSGMSVVDAGSDNTIHTHIVLDTE